MRICLGISYNGKEFHGWQKQPTLISVQSALEKALYNFTNENVNTYVAGRTDAGVHALEQVIHFDTNCMRDEFSWVRGTNTLLNRLGYSSIRVLWAKKVDDDFHARFHAVARTYHYALYANSIPPVCFQSLSGYLMQADRYGELNIESMKTAAKCLIGEHDFSSFRASICQAKSPVKTMYHIDIKQQNSWYIFTIKGNAFLHHMVRNIMGCLIKIGTDKKPSSWLQEVLESKDRKKAAPTFMPDGLYLAKIDYPEHLNIPHIKTEFPWIV
ncbi:MAG: tRNA pseudouridine synthase [Pseudomonadota bacterium]|jgi:tRNA pseudouridine38-40 synthase